jgi:hypothetical protein
MRDPAIVGNRFVIGKRVRGNCMRWKFNVAAQRPQDAGFINSYGDKGKPLSSNATWGISDIVPGA